MKVKWKTLMIKIPSFGIKKQNHPYLEGKYSNNMKMKVLKMNSKLAMIIIR